MKESQPKAIYLKDYQEPDYWIEKTDLTFSLEESKTTVTAEIIFYLNESKNKNTVPPLVLHGETMKLLSVAIDNLPQEKENYTLTDHNLTLKATSKRFTTKIVSEIDPANNTSLEGLYKSSSLFCTQCEAEGFRKITWYLDRPDVMACFTTKIIADKKCYPILLSNGNLIDEGDLEGNKHFATWEDPFKKPAYLFALVAGDLAVKTDQFTTCSGRDITLKIFSEAHNIDQCDYAMTSLKKSMKWDEEVYGREYDLDIFMIVAVDDFNMGAMENKGLNIFNASCVLAKPETATDATHQRVEAVVAHEYFHNWSGNRVTCRDWFQLSLKEGFTVFRDMSFSSDMNSATVKRIQDVDLLRSAQFAEDSSPMAHPVRPACFMEISNFYTLTIYEKGAEIVRMLHTLTGPKGFRKGTDLYFDRHDGQAVTCEDFIKALEDANGIDLKQFRLWYSQVGTPTIKAQGQYLPEEKEYQLTLQQVLPDTPDQLGRDKKPMYIPIALGLIDPNGAALTLNDTDNTTQILHVTKEKQTFNFKNINTPPTPSLLRGFSAPIKLEYDYTTEELQRLMQFDEDLFNRWDSCQRLMLKYLMADINLLQQEQPLSEKSGLITACKNLLADTKTDIAVIAEMLLPPSEKFIAEQMAVIDVHAIHQARQHLKQTLAKALESQLLECYHKLHSTAPYEPVAADIAKRSLKNICLTLLTALDKADYLTLANKQFEQANNMTDQQAALSCLINAKHNSALDSAQSALEAFYKKWKHDSNVMNMWFSVQSTSPTMGTLNHIKQLLKHEGFDYKNPNKLRSVIAAFAINNPVQFHQLNGEGYDFLADHIVILDKQNPQIASRLLTPLTRWVRYNKKTQEKMCKALQKVKNHAQSPDVQEVVITSLPT